MNRTECKKAGRINGVFVFVFFLIALLIFILIPVSRKKETRQKAMNPSETGASNQSFRYFSLRELPKVAVSVSNYIYSIEVFNRTGKKLGNCYGYKCNHRYACVIRTPILGADYIVVHSRFKPYSIRSFVLEDIERDFVLFEAPDDNNEVNEYLLLNFEINVNDRVFMVKNPHLPDVTPISGWVSERRFIDPFGEVCIVNFSFPDEMRGSPVFDMTARIVGIANSCRDKTGEIIYFFISQKQFGEMNIGGRIPFSNMSKHLNPAQYRHISDPFELGIFLYEHGDMDQAAIQFSRILDANPEKIDCYYYLGMCVKDRNILKAKEYFQRALEYDTNHIKSRFELALCEKNEMNEEAAVAGIEECLRIDPYFKEGIIELAGLYNRLQWFDSAIQLLEKAVFQNFILDKQMYLDLGVAYHRKGMDIEAYRALEKAQKLDPDELQVYREMACFFIDVKNWAIGIKKMKQALDQFPDHPEIMYSMALMSLGDGDFSDAKNILERMKSLKHDQVYIKDLESLLNPSTQDVFSYWERARLPPGFILKNDTHRYMIWLAKVIPGRYKTVIRTMDEKKINKRG